MPRPPRSNPKTRTRAIELRKESTPAERKLWAALRNDQLGVTFRRQHAIGVYIPDFVCVEKKLIPRYRTKFVKLSFRAIARNLIDRNQDFSVAIAPSK